MQLPYLLTDFLFPKKEPPRAAIHPAPKPVGRPARVLPPVDTAPYVPGLRVDAVDGGTALFEILVPGAGDDLLAQALQRGHVIEFTPVRPTLSEIYREVTA